MKHHLMRFRFGRKVYYLLAAALVVVVGAGCSTQMGGEPPLAAAKPAPDYVLTVSLSPDDTRQGIELRYGAEVMVWEPGVYAVLGLNGDLANQGLTSQGGVLEANRDAFLGGGEMAVMNGRSSLWAGGRSSLWAGGRSSLWAGGASTLWAGGEFTWMPENTATWQQIRLQQGQALAQNLGYRVKVAVIDTGVDLNHPALLAALAPASEWYDFYADDAIPQEEGTLGEDGYGHGTNVAGIIRQIAPRATILPLRVLGPDGQGDVADLAAAVQWAVAKGAKVINLSLGSDAAIRAVDEAIRQATAKGVLVVASTGNTADTRITWPASTAADKPNRLRASVTSVDADDRKSSFATYGRAVELAAPGENVYGPAPEMRLAAWSGTSMAAPMASGALALALGESLKVPAVNLADELRVRATDIYNNGLNSKYKDQLGKGRLNLEEFLRNVVEY